MAIPLWLETAFIRAAGLQSSSEVNTEIGQNRPGSNLTIALLVGARLYLVLLL